MNMANLGLVEGEVGLVGLGLEALLLQAQPVSGSEVAVEIEDLELLAEDALLHADSKADGKLTLPWVNSPHFLFLLIKPYKALGQFCTFFVFTNKATALAIFKQN